MGRKEPSYNNLLKENEKLKQQLASYRDDELFSELKKNNIQLNEYNEELRQTLDTIKKQKLALEENEQKLTLLENHISDVIWMLGLDEKFTYISSSVEKMFGYTKEEFCRLNISGILSEESYIGYKKKLENRIKEEQQGKAIGTVSTKLQHKKKNGEMFWAEVVSSPLRNSRGELIGLAGVTRDISERVKAEELINKLLVAVEQSPASIAITDTNGTIEYINKTFSKVTGYSFDEAVGKNPRILKSGKTPMRVYVDLWGTIKSGKVWKGELINKRKNGELYWERVIIAPIKNPDGKIVNFVAVKENITAQKNAEQELKDSQNRYKLLSDISLEGIIIHENGLILDINESVLKLTGFKMADLVGKQPFENLFTAESLELIKEKSTKNYELPYEVTVLRKDLSTFPAEIEAHQYKIGDRNVKVAALRDITYRKRIDDVLRSSLKMNEMLANHTEQEIIDWGLEEAVRLSDSTIGFFHYVNEDQKTVSLQTWSKNTLKNCHVPDKLEHYPISDAGTWVDCFYERKPVVHNDYEALAHKKGLPKGHFPLIRYISLPVIDEDKVKIIFGVGNKKMDYNQLDVDILGLFAKNLWMVIQRKRMERDLRESNAAKDKFFSIISHDLRSPIGSIQSLSEVILENLDNFSEEEIINSIRVINSSISSVFDLLENMLLWAQNHRSKIEFLPVPIAINEVIGTVLGVEKLDADKKEIELIKNIESEAVVVADRNMLGTVLRNLVANAIKFTNRGGKIEISTRKYNEVATEVAVKDSGVGINEQKLGKLFNLEDAVSAKGTENEKGTGLGLVLCKEFVERNGGKIWVESEVGQGTTFSFTVPTQRSS